MPEGSWKTKILGMESPESERCYDGQSHYYIDGDVLKNGIVPVIMYDTNEKKFYEVKDYCNEEIKYE